MKKIKDLKPTSQKKLDAFACTWWGKTDSSFSEQDLNEEIGMTTSSYLPGYFLHHAIEIDDLELVEDLCKNGADVNKIDMCCGHKTPLQFASELGRSNIAKILLEHGAVTEKINLNYTIDPFQQPLTFMWSVWEWSQGRTVDYDGVSTLLNNPDVQSNIKNQKP